MANAQFRVDFQVHLPSDTGGCGDTFAKSIYLSSPDLVNKLDAHKRAKATAKLRLLVWLKKNYPSFHKKFQVTPVTTQCVG
jgi:hypothetical protein